MDCDFIRLHKRTMNLFTAFSINLSFLTVSPAPHSDKLDFIMTKQTVTALWLVNDCAEWAVNLDSNFCQMLTHCEEPQKLVYKIVERQQQKVSKHH